MPRGIEFGTIHAAKNECHFSKSHINATKSTVNVPDVSLNDEIKRHNYNKLDDETCKKKVRHPPVFRNRPERSAQPRKSNYNERVINVSINIEFQK